MEKILRDKVMLFESVYAIDTNFVQVPFPRDFIGDYFNRFLKKGSHTKICNYLGNLIYMVHPLLIRSPS